MISVTLDSNIYISALIFGGEPLRVLKMAEDGFIPLDLSDAILEEFSRVLRDKFDWANEDIAAAQHDIGSFANHVASVEALTVVRDDADDNRIIDVLPRRVRITSSPGISISCGWEISRISRS